MTVNAIIEQVGGVMCRSHALSGDPPESGAASGPMLPPTHSVVQPSDE
ncbi:hypothetical protein [Mycobacterium sp. IS-1496]|nr:hypothetical protein [Mycobacterium sp. IS-1496]